MFAGLIIIEKLSSNGKFDDKKSLKNVEINHQYSPNTQSEIEF